MRLVVRIQVPTHGADVFPLFVEKLEAEDTAAWSTALSSSAAVKTVCATVEKVGVDGFFFLELFEQCHVVLRTKLDWLRSSCVSRVSYLSQRPLYLIR